MPSYQIKRDQRIMKGSFSEEIIIEAIQAGKITGTDLVLTVGETKWETISQSKVFNSYFPNENTAIIGKKTNKTEKASGNSKKGKAESNKQTKIYDVGGVAILGFCFLFFVLFFLLPAVSKVKQKAEENNAKNQNQIPENQSTKIAWGQTAKVGLLKIELRRVRESFYSGKSPGGFVLNSTNPALVVEIAISTPDPTQKYPVRGSKNKALVRDNFGNQLKSMRMVTDVGFECEIECPSGEKPSWSVC